MHEPNVPSSSSSDKDVVKNGGGRWGVLGGWWWQVGEMQGLNILKFILPKELKSKLFDVVILFSVTCYQISLV